MDTHAGRTLCEDEGRDWGVACTSQRTPKQTPSQETGLEESLPPNPADILALDFQPPELRGNKFPLLKPLSLWYFVLTSLGNESTSI